MPSGQPGWGELEENMLTADRGNGRWMAKLYDDRYRRHNFPWPLTNDKDKVEADRKIRKYFIVHRGEVIEPTMEQICKDCPNALARTLHRCKPFSYNCIAEDLIPTLDQSHTFPSTQGCFGASSYRRPHECTAAENFEEPEICAMTASEEMMKEWRENRSERSLEGACTVRGRKWKCKHCILEGSRYDPCPERPQSCSGPYFEQDLDGYKEKMEPWELHTMFCLTGKTVSTPFLKKYDNRWAGARSRIAAVSAALSTHDRYQWDQRYSTHPNSKRIRKWVRLQACSRPYGQDAALPYTVVCKALGVKPVNSWKQLKKAFPEIDEVQPRVFFLLYRILRNQGSSVRWTDYSIYEASVTSVCLSILNRYSYDRTLTEGAALRRHRYAMYLADERQIVNEVLTTLVRDPRKYRYSNNMQTINRLAKQSPADRSVEKRAEWVLEKMKV